MIRLFSTLCKCFQTIKNKDDYQSYVSFYNTIDKSNHQCPSCPVSGDVFYKDGTYKRDLVCRENSKTIIHEIEVKSVECKFCGHSHALLPSMVIPHSSYSFHFVISLLYDYITHNYTTIEKLCESYQISVSSFYRIYNRFLTDQISMSRLMEHEIINSKKLLSDLLSSTFEYLDDKLFWYFKNNGYSFLQPKCKMRQMSLVPKVPPDIIR